MVGFYPRAETIADDVTVRPDTRYGLSKAFGEALASLYAFKYGAEVMSIRIGNVADRAERHPRASPSGSARATSSSSMRIGLEQPGIRHEIVYGMSDNERAWWDNSNARRLGYRPQDRSEEFAAPLLAAGAGVTGNPGIDLNQGGEFCVKERT